MKYAFVSFQHSQDKISSLRWALLTQICDQSSRSGEDDAFAAISIAANVNFDLLDARNDA